MRPLFFLLLSLGLLSCDRPQEDRQGIREEQEEVTKPNDYSRGTDTKKRRQTGREEVLPEFEPSRERVSE
ncbi:MAG: hypothetical protein ACLGHN_10825 [Bacteriovoracia bacterium]